MERLHREQPMVEDVLFVPVMKYQGVEYREKYMGGEVEPENLPVDTMEGLLVPEIVPGGYYAEPAVSDAPSVDEGEELPEEGE